MVSFAILIAVVVATALAHVLLKVGMNQIGEGGLPQVKQPVRLAADLLTTPAILVAVPLYVASFVGWVLVLSRIRLSIAYPALAMMYLLIPLVSWFLLSEQVSRMHWAGIGVIIVGVSLILRAGLA